MVGLRIVIAPDQPTFADAVEAAEEDDAPFRPEAVGGELEVTGDRQGSFSLTREVGPPGFGLGGDEGRIHFDNSGDSLTISQFSYDGLNIFGEAEKCSVEVGEVDAQAGIAGAEVVCPEVSDVRDSATITLEGVVGLPAGLVAELDLPDTGGTLAAGDETWEVLQGQLYGAEAGTRLESFLTGSGFSLTFEYEDGHVLTTVEYQGISTEVPPDACSTETAVLGALSPNASRVELTISCEPFEVEGLGEVAIEGTVIVDEINPGSQ